MCTPTSLQLLVTCTIFFQIVLLNSACVPSFVLETGTDRLVLLERWRGWLIFLVCPQCSGSRIRADVGYVETPGISWNRDPTRQGDNSRKALSAVIIRPGR